jgi:hypothetical protein
MFECNLTQVTRKRYFPHKTGRKEGEANRREPNRWVDSDSTRSLITDNQFEWIARLVKDSSWNSKGPLLYSQQSNNSRHPEPDESSPLPHISDFSKLQLNIIICVSHTVSDFPSKTLHVIWVIFVTWKLLLGSTSYRLPEAAYPAYLLLPEGCLILLSRNWK